MPLNGFHGIVPRNKCHFMDFHGIVPPVNNIPMKISMGAIENCLMILICFRMHTIVHNYLEKFLSGQSSVTSVHKEFSVKLQLMSFFNKRISMGMKDL